LPLISLAVYLLTLLLPLLDPGRANYQTFAGAYSAIRISITLFFLSLHTVVVLVELRYHVNMTTVVGLALGVLFITLASISTLAPSPNLSGFECRDFGCFRPFSVYECWYW
jgi:hypothetical protein